MEYAHARPIPGAVATAGVNERVLFLRKTYAHLGGAIALFVLLQAWLINSDFGLAWAQWARMSWWLVLVLFIAVSWIADKWAHSDRSRGAHYLGLGVYVVAEALLTSVLLHRALAYSNGPELITQAAIATLLLFGGLTATVFITRKDFSFLRGILSVGSMVALGLIFMSMMFGFSLGLVFIVGMLALAVGYILFFTSRVLGHYPPTGYVGASLALFASIALLFWYVLQFFMSLSSD